VKYNPVDLIGLKITQSTSKKGLEDEIEKKNNEIYRKKTF